MPPPSVQQTKEFLWADVPVLSELILGCPDTSQVNEEMQKLKGSFQVPLICGRGETTHVSLFFLLISSHLPPPPKKKRSYACNIVLQSLEQCYFDVCHVRRKKGK